MLELRDIKKTYKTGDITVDALAGVSVSFRRNEFVAVLGQSGSGKTTMLNVIGGLDRYDSGDLIINSRTTKEYKDKDWDSYRNHSIGFVFQSYNLIPHQSVLSNVELALTLSGVSKPERRKRAKEVLAKVGLADQMRKKPNQMSGGQMQRVAIARALINNPDILLADEPTGALDSETSLQIMDLISEIARDRLVVMVTHNPELATKYANRIISLKDGVIVDDTNPFTIDSEEAPIEKKAEKVKKKGERTSMSSRTAFSLSFNNLLTKKGRTMLTSFAGSIGIIGIALILSLSSGMRAYIASIEKDALSSFPITIDSQAVDMSGMMEAFAGSVEDITTADHPLDKVYTNNIIVDMMKLTSTQMTNNDLKRFKQHLESTGAYKELTSAIQYGYDFKPQIYRADTTDGVYKVFPNDLLDTFTGGQAAAPFSLVNTDLWQEMLGNKELLDSQYDIVAGEWPDSYDEVVIVVDQNNEITDAVLYFLGILDPNELNGIIQSAMTGEEVAIPEEKVGDDGSYTYDEFLNLKFKLVLSTDYYKNNGQGVWEDMSGDEEYMKNLLDKSVDLKIAGIVKPAGGATAVSTMGAVAYTSDLTKYVINHVNSAEVVAAQKASPEIDVFTGLPFKVYETAQTPAKEESTTAAPAATTVSNAAVFEKPKVGNIGVANGTPTAQMLAEDFTMPNVENAMTEDEIYNYINKNFTGEEKDQMTEVVKLILKDIRSGSERTKLISYLDKMLAGQNIEGVGTVTGAQAYTYLQMMDKESKLAMITSIIQSSKNGTLPISGEGETKPDGEETTTPEEPEEEKIKYSESTYEENMSTLGVVSIDNPNKINMFPTDFEAKAEIQLLINEYNDKQKAAGHEEYVISYTDLIGTILTSVTKIINIVTYALIAFVAISLVVSSIMIGVITYISVLERTKEIGVLRSIGASKNDVSQVFLSETFIVGLVSGVLGIGITLLLNIPINIIIDHYTGISTIATLPFYGGISLILISVVLTVVAGLVPSRLAAKKDPVEALRTE